MVTVLSCSCEVAGERFDEGDGFQNVLNGPVHQCVAGGFGDVRADDIAIPGNRDGSVTTGVSSSNPAGAIQAL